MFKPSKSTGGIGGQDGVDGADLAGHVLGALLKCLFNELTHCRPIQMSVKAGPESTAKLHTLLSKTWNRCLHFI
eukprot:1141262-Pelagomonas_calceolata.AAC.8